MAGFSLYLFNCWKLSAIKKDVVSILNASAQLTFRKFA